MRKHRYLFAFVATLLAGAAQAHSPVSDPATSGDSIGHDYATKALAHARKDCASIRSMARQDESSVVVECASNDKKTMVQYRITPKHTALPEITFLRREAITKVEAKAPTTPEQHAEKANKYARAIIVDYRYECAKVLRVTTQADDSLVAVCTPDIGREPISYRLVETPGAHMGTRVTPLP